MNIEPLDAYHQALVTTATHDCIARAARLHGVTLTSIPIHFDLGGRAAGMYRVAGGRRCIRYNPYLFAKYFDDNLATTVPHEVAHYVADILHGLRRIRPHGAEWQAIMRSLGAEPRATGNYDLSGIPVRRQRRFRYDCICSSHALSTRRHNNVLKGRARYRCRKCDGTIRFTGQELQTSND